MKRNEGFKLSITPTGFKQTMRALGNTKAVRNFALQYGLILPVYVGGHIYMGLRGWQSFGHLWMTSAVFTVLVLAFALTPPLTAGLDKVFIRHRPLRYLASVGFYWVPFTLYVLMGIAIMDLARLINIAAGNRLSSIVPDALINGDLGKLLLGILFVSGALALLVVGGVRARKPVITPYTIHLPKRGDGVETLTAAVISDLHLGTTTSTANPRKMLDMINNLEPDLLLLLGDITDCPIYTVRRSRFDEALRAIHTRYGIYGVFGNHEYMNAMMLRRDESKQRSMYKISPSSVAAVMDELTAYYKNAGVTMLRDQCVQVAGLNIVGRDDLPPEGETTRKRASMQDLMLGVDNALPVIVLDHQPKEFLSARDAGADVMLSGHTHKGQLFPLNLLSQKLYKRDYGHTVERGMHLIVSSGLGTWGPPMRLMSRGEIVKLTLKFDA